MIAGQRHSPETRLKMSVSAKKCTRRKFSDQARENMRQAREKSWSDPSFRAMMSARRGEEWRKKVSNSIKLKWQDPEYRRKVTSHCPVKISRGQFALYKQVVRRFPTAVLEFPVMGSRACYHLDIAIPELKLDIEYDGNYWHRNRKKVDAARDADLRSIGWRVMRIRENNLSQILYILGGTR